MKNDVLKMEPTEVAESAERQLLNLKKTQDDKMNEVKEERNRIKASRRTLSTLIYAAGNGYRSVYPQAEAFLEGRIKSPDSVETKTKNEFTEILSEIEENPNIDQTEILKKIEEINFKDLFAFSIVTTVPPEKFKTGSDEINEEFAKISNELRISEKRIAEHKDFTMQNRANVIKITNEIRQLRDNLKNSIESNEKEKSIDKIKNRIQESIANKDVQNLNKLLLNFEETISTKTKEQIQFEIDKKNKDLTMAKSNVEYGQKNMERTLCVYNKALRDLQYKMSKYYVVNLSKFSTFKYWGTELVRKFKEIIKPGFRAVNTGYKVIFSNNDKKEEIRFEAQGKGELDYKDAEFLAAGAEYHEAQKTKEGIISKNIEMPDFTIIGKDLTNKIEKEVRTKYKDITTIEELEELGMESIVENLKLYEKEIANDIQEREGENAITKKIIRKKVSEAFEASKENCIKEEISQKINACINEMADGEKLEVKLQKNEEFIEYYEKLKLELYDENIEEKDLNHIAKVNLLYHIKEKEIEKYAETSIPMFFRANLPKNQDEEINVYWFTTGESLYRFFTNRLNGLKDENGKFKYQPQEQQKIALLKLNGLFKENNENFYTYDKNTNTFGSLKIKNEGSNEKEL